MFELGFRLSQVRLCGCCREPLSDDDKDLATLALFGAAAYAVCPVCTRPVPPDVMHDRNYRQRYRRVLAKRERTP